MSSSLTISDDYYSDDDLNIVRDICFEADQLLAHYPTSSHEATTALFTAYNDVLPRYGLDPDDEKHLSGLLFKIASIRLPIQVPLMEMFRVTMQRMGIKLDFVPPDYESGSDTTASEVPITERSTEQLSIGSPVPTSLRDSKASSTDGLGRLHSQPAPVFEYAYPTQSDQTASSFESSLSGDTVSTHPDLRGTAPQVQDVPHSAPRAVDMADIGEDNGEKISASMSLHYEKAQAGFERHRLKFHAASNLRTWQRKSDYIGGLASKICEARELDDLDSIAPSLEAWRLKSTTVHPRSRMEWVANRTYEIYSTHKSLAAWRHAACKKAQLSTVAEQTNRLQAVSAVVTQWSEEAEESAENEQRNEELARRMREFQLKSKVFGLRRPFDPSAPAEQPLKDMAQLANVGSTALVDPSTFVTAVEPMHEDEDDNEGLDEDDDEGDANDERLQVAKRHMIRFRLMNSWVDYTSEYIWKRDQQLLLPPFEEWQRNTEQSSHQDEILQQLSNDTASRARSSQGLQQWQAEAKSKAESESLLESYAERAFYYNKCVQALPQWQEATHLAAEKQSLQESYADRTNYYYRSTAALAGWRQAAKGRRKERLKHAYLESRKVVKKAMGARAIAQWRARLPASYERFTQMNLLLLDVTDQRESELIGQSLDIWRHRAWARQQEAQQSVQVADTLMMKAAVGQWQDSQQDQLVAEAQQMLQERAAVRRIKGWNTSSLQRNTSVVGEAVDSKIDRRRVRSGLGRWRYLAAQRAAEEEYPATPARPTVLRGTTAVTTTPLGPPPSRFGSSRRNLRVSWAQ